MMYWEMKTYVALVLSAWIRTSAVAHAVQPQELCQLGICWKRLMHRV